MASISIVLPNYNHAIELVTSLDAIAAQTRPPDEIVLVEDGSTDNSIIVIDSYRQRLPNLRVLRNSERLGVALAVGRGIEASKNDWILMASADEKLASDACATLAKTADRFPDAKLIVSEFTEWRPADGTIRVHGHETDSGMWYTDGSTPAFISPEKFGRLARHRFILLAANTALIRREALIEVGGFDPKLKWHSDWFALYAIAFRFGFCAVPKPLAWFRVSSESYSGKGMQDPKSQRQVALEIQRKLISPEFRDIDIAIMKAPIVMSTFFRATICVMAARPLWYGRLSRLGMWWIREFLTGRRPAAWSRLLERAGLRSLAVKPLDQSDKLG